MVTQRTYTGLIDETFPNRAAILQVANPAPGVLFTLDGSDLVWTSVADLPLELAQKQLVAHAKEINGLEDEVKAMRTRGGGSISPQELSEFKTRQEYMLTYLFPLVQAHLNVVQHIRLTLFQRVIRKDNYGELLNMICPDLPHVTRWDQANIEPLLYRDGWYMDVHDAFAGYIFDCIKTGSPTEPLSKVLRLISIASLTSQGLLHNGGILDKYKAAIEDRYGFEAGLVVTRLVKTGMIKTVMNKSVFLTHGDDACTWSSIVKHWDLCIEDVSNEQEDDGDILTETRDIKHGQYFSQFIRGSAADEDLTFLYDFYMPLSLRVIELALENQWTAHATTLDLIEGPSVHEVKDHRPPANLGALSKAATRIQTNYRGHRVRTDGSGPTPKHAGASQFGQVRKPNYSGILEKKGSSFPWRWQDRFFSVTDNVFTYQARENDGDILGSIDLHEWYVDQNYVEAQEKGILLKPINDFVEGNEELKLVCNSLVEKRQWLLHLGNACQPDPAQLDEYRRQMMNATSTTLGGVAARGGGEDAEAIASSLTMIFFLGGVTKSEIAGIRHLAQRENQMYIVGTTGVVSGKSLINSLTTSWSAADQV